MTSRKTIKRVAVFGGSGFLGSKISKYLASEGLRVSVVTRHPDSAATQVLARNSELIEPVYGDVRDEESVALAMSKSDAAVNAVGLYVETGTESFELVHEIGALNVAHQAHKLNLQRFVHISGIGADMYSSSRYIRSRGKAELMIADVLADAVILRPSVMFGPDDKFINTLNGVVAWAPVLPLFGRGETKLQPVFVEDVAKAVFRVIAEKVAAGKVYELGGPRIYSYRELLKLLLHQSGRKKILMPVPFAIWDLIAEIPSPITRAQVTLMKHDNVVCATALTFEDLGIQPLTLEDILPQYAFPPVSSRV